MPSGLEDGVPQPPAFHALTAPSAADLEVFRVAYRVVGVFLIASGALDLSSIVLDLVRGRGDRAMLATIGAAARLVGGTLLLIQRYSAGPDTLRRSIGILEMALGLSILTYSLQSIAGVLTGGLDALAPIIVFNLVLGSALVPIGAIFLWSRGYAAWYRRRWEKWERRRAERLALPVGR